MKHLTGLSLAETAARSELNSEAAWQSAVAQLKLSRRKRWLAQGVGPIALAAGLGLAVSGGLNCLQSPEQPLIQALSAGLVLNRHPWVSNNPGRGRSSDA